jgi:hypothetical protein
MMFWHLLEKNKNNPIRTPLMEKRPFLALMIGQKNYKNMDICTIIPGCGLLAFGFLLLIYLGNLEQIFFSNILKMEMQHPIHLVGDGLLDYTLKANTTSSEWNINKFSSKKYNNLKLNENAGCCIENKNYEIIPLQFENINYENSLMLFHNLDFSFALKYQTILQCNHYGMINFNSILQEHNYAKDVLELKSKINQNLQTLIKEKYNSEIIIHNKEELNKIIKEKNISTIILPYLTTGYENDFISTIKNEINVKYLNRDYDKFCWPFATKGYFAFKEQIPKIIAKFL